METDSFINALRRFIARRGKVREIRSDQGTNFIGAKNELNAASKEIDQNIVNTFLLENHCDWIKFNFNVPSSSHMGGVWERLIRTVRSVLSSLLNQLGTQLDDETLRTLMTETENIVNSRPLTVDNLSDPSLQEPLTPNHLLTQKTTVVLPPPGNFERPDLYSRKRWRRVQYLANQFWVRWQREYCNLLYKRQKWIDIRRNTKEGDIVLFIDKDAPRNQWPLAKVSMVYPSEDGLIRKVQLLFTKDGKRKLLDRPIHKLILILAQDEENADSANV